MRGSFKLPTRFEVFSGSIEVTAECAMPYQMSRVEDGKIIKEDEATFQERQKKVRQGILMSKAYTCGLCSNTLCATSEAGLYDHWKKFHCVDEDIEDDSSETEMEELQRSPSLIDVRTEPLEPGHKDRRFNGSCHYPKDIFTYKVNVVYKNMDFLVSASPNKEFPPDKCCSMREIKNQVSEEITEDFCDYAESWINKPNLDLVTPHSPKIEDFGPMPKLSPQCSPHYDNDKLQIDDTTDVEEELTEKFGDLEKLAKKRKHSDMQDNNGRSKRYKTVKKSKPSSHTSGVLYDAMRRGERLWLCKMCDDYFNSIELLKYHIAQVHKEDASKVNRFNVATWDLEISRTFTSPHEIELEHELNLLEPTDHIDQVAS